MFAITGMRGLGKRRQNFISDGGHYNFYQMGVTTIFIGPRCPWGPIFGSGCLSVSPRPCADLTDVTLADEDTN